MSDSETEPGSREEKRSRVRRAATVWSNGASRADNDPETSSPPASEAATSSDEAAPESAPATPSQTDTDIPAASTAAGLSPREATDGAAHASATPPPPTPTPPAPAKEESTTAAHSAEREPTSRREPGTTRKQVKGAVDQVRTRLGSIVWIVAVLCALVLAGAALLVALGANDTNDIVLWLRERANNLDGPFHDLFRFDGKNRREKSLLVNNGIAAVAYLVVGKVLERLIKP